MESELDQLEPVFAEVGIGTRLTRGGFGFSYLTVGSIVLVPNWN